ncbi:MAG TPA: hypothetical protein VMW41_04605 [Candidatus Bathyarchaeia archaeon]|nr:hypothetical protein [Candidatus Bathyarchaeia archaeon]
MQILHGANIVASRQALIKIKEAAKGSGKEVIELPEKKLDLALMKQIFESRSLFGQDRLVIIENFFSLPASRDKQTLLHYLKALPAETSLILWDKKQIDGRLLKSFPVKVKITNFKLSPLLFKFLDSFKPGNARLILDLMHQTLKTEATELVFYMLARRTRDLLVGKDLGKAGLSGLAPWRLGNLLRQGSLFSWQKLLNFHRQLLKIDCEQKTGRASLPLKSALDLLITDL